MLDICEFKSYLFDILSNSKSYCISYDYPSQLKSTPLTTPYVVLSFSKTSSTKFSNIFLGRAFSSENHIYGNLIDLEISLDIYNSVSSTSSACFDIFYTISQKLIQDKNLNFSNISTGQLKYDNNLRCFHLPSSFNSSIILTQQSTFSNISNFDLSLRQLNNFIKGVDYH